MSRLNIGLPKGNRQFPLVFVLLLLTFSPMRAQDTAAPPPVLAKPGESPSVAARPATDRRVTLDVQAADKSGAPIRGLQQQDFTLLDDNQPQKIVSFQAVDAGAAASSDPPVEVIIVVDAINTDFHNAEYERDEVKKFSRMAASSLGP